MQAQAKRAAMPSGVVTFLFTDIEGSTRRWEADADAMRAALAAHDATLREAVANSGGSIFKHTGDGVCAVFASPRAAVDAAITAQRQLELPVRMGIATGEAERRDGDYFGAVLNRASRIMSAGHGGQILLDGGTAGLLADVGLIDLGPQRLRDIAKAVHVYQAQAPGLRVDFLPLRTVVDMGNLQPASAALIGREHEVGTVEGMLRTHRLVTLTGPGGVGKTRLAIEIGRRLAKDYPDGVWLIQLATLSDPAAVPEAVAAALGITQQPRMTLSDSVARALEGRARLLIFDNCEHVLGAAADLIETIFTHSATVRILATSREGLRIYGEQIWPVPSLDLHAGAESSAVTLFVEHAMSVAPNVSLAGDGDMDAVVEICRRLDGIPLAIELAASRMVSMTAPELHDRLSDRFRLLVGSRRGLERHQTLHHAVQWSYDLLDSAEKSVLTRCSVFSGGFDLLGARVVGGCVDDFATLDLLDALIRKSLLLVDRTSGRTRFAMLETIRQFAEEQLVARGEAEEFRARHARHYASLEMELVALWDGPRQRESYAWLGVELPNLRVAFRWAADAGDLDTAAAIANTAAFLGIRGLEQYEAVGWAESLIAPAEAVQHLRLAELCVIAAQCYTTGRVDDAVRYADMGRRLIATGGFDAVPFESEIWVGGGYLSKGEPEQWVSLCREVIDRHPGRHTVARVGLVLALNFVGAGEEAATMTDGLIADADDTENPDVAALALLASGIALRRSDPPAARLLLRRGLDIAEDNGNKFAESQLAASLARLTAIHGDPAEAFGYLAQVIGNYRDSGSFALMHSPLVVLAGLLCRLERFAPAAQIAAFATNPWTLRANPELQAVVTKLREVLTLDEYESRSGTGQSMANSAMAAYALAQIELGQLELA